MAKKTSGQEPFRFSLCDDLYTLPERARPHEVDLHGGFADDTAASGYIYYGMPGCGIMRISADLTAQEIIELPSDLKPINFHSTKIIEFDGKRRLVLPANNDAKVAVVGLDGNVDYILSRPEFEEYRDEEVLFKPTDTAFADGTLYVSDGYGANYHLVGGSVNARLHRPLWRRQDRRSARARPVRDRARSQSGPRRTSPVDRRPPARPLPAHGPGRPLPLLAPDPRRLQAVRHRLQAARRRLVRRGRQPGRSAGRTASADLRPGRPHLRGGVDHPAPRKTWASSWPTTSTTPSGTNATGRST